MKELLATILILLTLVMGCTSKLESKKESLNGPYFGIIPTDSVQILAPEIISTDQFEYNGTFSPDGTEFYYTMNLPNRGQIVFLELVNDI